MANKKIIAVAFVAILVIAGAGVIVIAQHGEESTDPQFIGGTSGSLQVYGNVNNDYYINEKDITFLNEIINEEKEWEKDYPFADVNNDKKVDTADVDKLKEIIAATPSNKVVVNVLGYSTDKPEGYIEEIKYPVTSAILNFTGTVVSAVEAMGMVDEFSCFTGNPEWQTFMEEKLVEPYLDLVSDKSKYVGANSKPDVTAVGNFAKGDDPVTLYLISNAVKYDKPGFRPGMEELGVSTINLQDSMADPLAYASCMLLLGFLFGTNDNNYMDRSIELANWMYDYNTFSQGILDKINSGDIVKKKAVVTSSTNRVSSLTSNNTQNLKYSGLDIAIDAAAGSGTTIPYNPDTDQWLNTYDVDFAIILTSNVEEDWYWFNEDKDMKNAPEKMLTMISTYKTLQCYKDGTVAISLAIPAPFRNMMICEAAYPELFVDHHAAENFKEFCYDFYGWEKGSMDKVQLIGTPADFGLI